MNAAAPPFIPKTREHAAGLLFGKRSPGAVPVPALVEAPTLETVEQVMASIAANPDDTEERRAERRRDLASALGRKLLDANGLDYTMLRDFQTAAPQLADEAYWGFLGALFMGLDNEVDLGTWRMLFYSSRRGRLRNLMKADERRMFGLLPGFINIYRAHLHGETDWLLGEPNTMDVLTRNLGRRDITHIGEYTIHRKDIAAVFTRRKRLEVLCLDVSKLTHVGDIPVNRNYDAGSA